MSAELKVWFAARGRVVPMVMENIAGNRSVICVIYRTPRYCDALDFAGTTNVVQTCHNFGMAIRMFDLKFCKNPYH